MVGHCSHCCNIMNNRVDVSDLEVGSRIRVGDNDLATVKYIGEVSILSRTKKINSLNPNFQSIIKFSISNMPTFKI